MIEKNTKQNCEVCNVLGLDSYLLNGDRNRYHKNTLYRVLKNKTLDIYLCHFHDIELFQLGETGFLKQNIEFSRSLITKFKTASDNNIDDLL